MSAAPDVSPLELSGGTRHTREEWESAAAAVLRKAGRLTEDDPDDAVWAALGRTTLDGVAVPPLGTPELVGDLETSGRPARVGEWDIRVPVDEPDAAAANRQLLEELDTGATSLWLQVGPAGLPVAGIATALGDVLLDAAPVVLDAPADPVVAAQAFAAVAVGGTLADGASLGIDPVGALVRGAAPTGSTEVAPTVEEALRLATELGCGALVVDGTAVHDLGASDAQELGYALATAATYLRVLTATGLDAAAAAELVTFRLAVTDEQFVSIAKLRAARRLWARMLELGGVPEAGRGTHVHAVTSRPMMSRYAPWVNMLRTCVAAFAAGVAGADAVTVLPFDTRLGMPDAFSRRIARNTSSLLISESHLARVSDPAGGAWSIERLTDDLAVAAWEELGRVEQAGGVLAAVLDGSLRGRIDRVVAERDRQVATRERPLTGLSEFPSLRESLPEREPRPELPQVRPYGHAFEALRDEPAADKVFLATMGPVSAHTARATFATNLFAAGGIDVVNAGAHDDATAVVSSYAEAGPESRRPVVCLAGADQAYAAWGAELVAALRDAGARWVVLAGRPGERTVAAELVDDWAANGVDALAFLRRTREQLS